MGTHLVSTLSGRYLGPDGSAPVDDREAAGRWTGVEATGLAGAAPGREALPYDGAPRFAPGADLDRAVRVLEAENDAMRAALLSLPDIAEEIRVAWDQGMRAGKLLMAMAKPEVRYRPDVTALHEATRFRTETPAESTESDAASRLVAK